MREECRALTEKVYPEISETSSQSDLLFHTPDKLFGTRLGIRAICHSLSNDFYKVSEWEKDLKPIILLPVFEILQNHVQLLSDLGLNKAKPKCNGNCT
jgi:hypothetical protein